MVFLEKLKTTIRRNDSLLCVRPRIWSAPTSPTTPSMRHWAWKDFAACKKLSSVSQQLSP